jgi:phosphotransferase system enzyme I (PtsI)
MINHKLSGIAISKGIVIGNAKRLDFDKNQNELRTLNVFDSEVEKTKFDLAKNSLIIDSERIIEKYNHKEKIKSIIESEIMFLQDQELTNGVNNLIDKGNRCEIAIEVFFANYIELISNNGNKLSRVKVNDIQFLKHKLIQEINDVENDYSEVSNRVIITSLLNTDEILKIHENGAIGFVTEFGSNLSHSSIISRSLNIPAVFGVKSILSLIKDNDEIIIDGYLGNIIINPDKKIKKLYKEKQNKADEELKSYQDYKDTHVKNKIGSKIRFYSNINNMIDLENTLINNADGIGLVRTENLVHEIEEIFEEDIQFEIYNRIAESIYPKTVTFRLFDFGYDKLNLNDEKENNPALGLRGVRYLLRNNHILETQLNALIRSSINGNVKLLIPMVTFTEEIVEIKRIASKISDELNIQMPKIGTMVETPSAASLIKQIANESDFISIGTNDLMQYYFAADRNNEHVKEYLDYRDKSFIKLLTNIKKTCDKKEKELIICGQIASDEKSLILLVKKGFLNFSVIPARILLLKKTLLK